MEFSLTHYLIQSALTIGGIITFCLLVRKAVKDEQNHDDHDHSDNFGQEN